MHRFWDKVVEPILKILQPKTIVEVGSDTGTNTRNLLEFCRQNDAKLHIIDPLPKYDIATWQEEYGEHLVPHLSLSLKALPLIDRFDVALIDGDHNWYTVFNELKLIESRSMELSQPFPLVLLHDICWPYGRRDMYYDPENIPDAYRKPYRQKGISPDSVELVEKGGLNSRLYNAINENNLRNGVLTAIEDFLKETEQIIELIKIPGLHGLGILIPSQLKEQNVELAKFLENLKLSPFAIRYIEHIERLRIRDNYKIKSK